MTDRQLSTRDLAARSDSDETDSSPESQQPTDDTTGLSATSDQDSRVESAGSDASLARDPAADHPPTPKLTPAAPADTRVQETRSAGTEHQPLFATDQTEHFTNRWQEIQTSSSTSPATQSQKQTPWSPTSCNASPPAFPRNASDSKPSGTAATTSPPKTSASPSPATAPSSTDSSPPSRVANGAGGRASPAPRGEPHNEHAGRRVTPSSVISETGAGERLLTPQTPACPFFHELREESLVPKAADATIHGRQHGAETDQGSFWNTGPGERAAARLLLRAGLSCVPRLAEDVGDAPQRGRVGELDWDALLGACPLHPGLDPLRPVTRPFRHPGRGGLQATAPRRAGFRRRCAAPVRPASMSIADRNGERVPQRTCASADD